MTKKDFFEYLDSFQKESLWVFSDREGVRLRGTRLIDGEFFVISSVLYKPQWRPTGNSKKVEKEESKYTRWLEEYKSKQGNA